MRNGPPRIILDVVGELRPADFAPLDFDGGRFQAYGQIAALLNALDEAGYIVVKVGPAARAALKRAEQDITDKITSP